ncbi:MAG: LemA family protein [Piscirickettsiaceae bacterium]|nr:MAG: LemA family protein [Piscirickettsiaceae bacterium]PCI69932.1 MAG: LemA family protein [Piscirickettsiaceae bacterium]
MSVSGFIILAIVVVAAGYAVAIYNSLVSVKHNVSKAWSNIDVLLKQRHDELPKLIETCKQYMKHEKETLEQVMLARSGVSEALGKSDVAGVGQAETKMRQGLLNLFAVAEAYPDLKADRSFQALQKRISDLENNIADRREYYNESVNANNVRIEQFPDILIARFFNFKDVDLLEFEESEIADVNVKDMFG